MADKNATIHTIPLKTTDLCLNKYNADIKPYEGFNKNNSAFFGNVLRPFFGKKLEEPISSNSYVYKNGDIYKVKEDGIYIQPYGFNEDGSPVDEIRIIDTGFDISETSRILKREKYINSGVKDYLDILGWFEEDEFDSMLCSNSEGELAIIRPYMEGGELKYHVNPLHIELSGVEYRYKTNEKISFCEHIPNKCYVFCIGPMLIVSPILIDEETSVCRIQSFGSRVSEYDASCMVGGNDNYIVCIHLKGSNTSSFRVVNANTATITSISNITFTGGATGHTTSGTTNKCYFDNRGNVVIFSNDIKKTEGSNIYVYNLASNLTYSASSLSAVLTSDYSLAGSESISSSLLNVQCDNFMAIATSSFKTTSPISVVVAAHYQPAPTTVDGSGNPAYYKDVQVEEEYSYWGWKWYIIPWKYTKTVTTTQSVLTLCELIPEHTEQAPGGWSTVMLNSSNLKKTINVPLLNTGEYVGGTMANIGKMYNNKYISNFRALYNNGELSALSCTDQNSSPNIGTLLCGMATADTRKCPCITKGGDVLYFVGNNGTWLKIALEECNSETYKDITLSVANDRYIIANINNYTNCVDAETRNLYHMASDWNNRLIVSVAGYTGDTTSATFSEYLSKNCEQYFFASGQSTDYSTPFVSSFLPLVRGWLPKTANIKVEAQSGYTYDDNDINIYWDKVSVGSYPYYKYSIDDKTQYINTHLQNTYWNFSDNLILTASIFAEYISGFTNKGIVVDNGHSYIQTFANASNPVFSLIFSSELEGISASFIVQGQFFVIIGETIYSYSADNGLLNSIVNIGAMELIGYTPYQAILWSNTNKTFYSFTGDNGLSVLVQADEIETIYSSSYNPNTMSIYVVSNVGVYIFGNEQLIKISDEEYLKCYPLDTGACLVGEDKTLYISYNKEHNYDIIPIVLETEYYGQGNFIKSVNDCVYIRIFKQDYKDNAEDNAEGKVIVSSSTLNDVSKWSETKEFQIKNTDWDKGTNTILLRYQPKFQEGEGFRVKIVSPFAITQLAISEKAVAMTSTSHNN